ncbi:helix-turn-helix domain-containing protein [Aequorivita sp. Q41]|uniref:helix-turn-helix domain-containing protein n=1 Tax=Aequorivita sp. Q41 TaxID=3153300 RepID=UPI003242D98A
MGFIKKVLLYSFILNCTFFFGQQKEALSQLTYQSINDSINKYIYSNLPIAIEASEAYILKAQNEQNKKEEWQGIFNIAYIYTSYIEYDKAQTHYEKALNFATKNNLKVELTKTYVLGASIQLGLSNASKALDLADKALLLAEEIGDNLLKENVLQLTSYILQISGDHQKAIDIRKKSILIYKNKSIDSVFNAEMKTAYLTNIYASQANSFLKLKQADSAKQYAKFISELITPTDSCNKRTLHETLGEIDYFEKKYTQAKENFKTASKLCDQGIPVLKLRNKYAIGKSEHGAGKFEAAKTTLQQALDEYNVKPSEEGFMSDFYKLLADSYKETGDFEKANYYFEKFINTTSEFDKIKSEVKASTKAQEIETFKNELKILEAEKDEKQNYLNYILLGATLIILALLFLLLRFYQIKKKNEVKFQELLSKIETAKSPTDIINTKDEILEETNTSDVSEEVKSQILDGLKKLEKQEYFLKLECNSYNVAKKINTNTSYLSKVINSHYGKNFNTYINDLRINYTIMRLKNDVLFRSYSIQSIAEEVGYKSADSFTKYFKKDTGLNPSFYIKEIKNIT